MSGIAGIIRLDGQPSASSPALQRGIAHRGPDGTGEWLGESALLLHAQLRTTADAAHETQPLVDTLGGCILVADLRLDYRQELIAQLQLEPQPGQVISDAQLVIAAYRRWGSQCPIHLDGDFSFALWDVAQRTLFCARDPFGVKPMVYCLLPGRLFAFASQARGLLELPEVPRELDEARIASFLEVRFNDHESTFHRSLRRLPGGHSLKLQDGKVQVARYWSIERVRPLPLASDADYAAGYRECFANAVQTRMRVARPCELGSMLSGGLDSTSIACWARDVLAADGVQLPVFSWIFSDAMDADEREYQDIVVAAGGLLPHTIDSATSDYSPWTDLDRFMADGPLYAPNFYLNYALGNRAREAGVRALLDGLGGDSTISRGSARLLELFWRGHPRTLLHELRSLARLQNPPASLLRLFSTHVVAPLLPPSLLRVAQRVRGRRTANLLAPRLAAVNRATADRHQPAFTARQQHLAQLGSPMLAEGLELMDRILADCQVEGRYPFFDRRLAEYCVSLPAAQKLAGGYSRVVARRALQGSMPHAVQWRAGKGKPGLHIIPSLLAHRARLDDLFVQDPSAIAPYVNVDAVRSLYRDFIEQRRPPDFRNVICLWSVAVLGYWLRCTRC